VSGRIGENDPRDEDGDGVPFTEDCDDGDPLASPDLSEWCDGVDNDCDGTVDTASCTAVLEVQQQMRLDLLIVLDDTPSMDDDLAALADGMADLLPFVVDPDPAVTTAPSRDTHIGVVVMDADDPTHGGRLVPTAGRRFTDATMSRDAVASWVDDQLIDITDPGAFDAPGVDVADAALFAGHSENTGFRRDDAHLAILFASDSDNDGGSLGAVGFLEALQRGGVTDVHAHAVVSTDGSCPDFPGETYLQLAQLTGGLTQSICEDGYGPFLSAVGQVSAQQGLRDTFTLDSPAQPGSVTVAYEIVGGLEIQLAPNELVLLDATTVRLLTSPPPVDSTVRIAWQRLDPRPEPGTVE
jgi:hypothetical protein